MLLKKPSYRRFRYEPRFYNPDRDEKERLKRLMRQERDAYRRRKRRPVLLWIAIFALVIYLYLYLAGVAR
jgi:predicted nucleic acid-binding Zn ribbon protein